MNKEPEQKFDEPAYFQLEELNAFDYAACYRMAGRRYEDVACRQRLCADLRQRHAALHFSLADERRTVPSFLFAHLHNQQSLCRLISHNTRCTEAMPSRRGRLLKPETDFNASVACLPARKAGHNDVAVEDQSFLTHLFLALLTYAACVPGGYVLLWADSLMLIAGSWFWSYKSDACLKMLDVSCCQLQRLCVRWVLCYLTA